MNKQAVVSIVEVCSSLRVASKRVSGSVRKLKLLAIEGASQDKLMNDFLTESKYLSKVLLPELEQAAKTHGDNEQVRMLWERLELDIAEFNNLHNSVVLRR